MVAILVNWFFKPILGIVLGQAAIHLAHLFPFYPEKLLAEWAYGLMTKTPPPEVIVALQWGMAAVIGVALFVAYEFRGKFSPNHVRRWASQLPGFRRFALSGPQTRPQSGPADLIGHIDLKMEPDWVMDRINEPKKIIRAQLVLPPNISLEEARSQLTDVKKRVNGEWHTLNAGNKMDLPWPRLGGAIEPSSYEKRLIVGKEFFGLLSFYTDEKRLAIESRTCLPSFEEKDNLSPGSYELTVRVITTGGVNLTQKFILDWSGEFEKIVITALDESA